MSRKSKKGFKRLENHELTEFTSLNGRAGDSGSESELLDLTTVEERDMNSRYYSCCCWMTCFFISVLLLIVVALGVFCGYLFLSVWQLDNAATTRHSDLASKIDSLKTHIDELKKASDDRIEALIHDLSSINSTVASLQVSTQQIRGDLKHFDERLKVIENQPQEKLIKEVDSIHQEMQVLNHNMDLFNGSLDVLQEMRGQVASVSSIMSNYDSQFHDYKKKIGDVSQTNDEIKNSLIVQSSKVEENENQLKELKNTLTSSHDQMQQSNELLTAQLTTVQKVVAHLNETLPDEVDSLWANITKVESGHMEILHQLSIIESKIKPLDHNIEHLPTTTAPELPNKGPVTEPSSSQSLTTTTTSTVADDSSTTTNKEQSIDHLFNSSTPVSDKTGVPNYNASATGATTNNVPSGEPTTPSTDSTESHFTGATDDVPKDFSSTNKGMDSGGHGPGDGSKDKSQLDSFTNSTNISHNVTEEDGGSLVTTTDESVLDKYGSEDEVDKKIASNKEADSMLRQLLLRFVDMDTNFDTKLSLSEFGGLSQIGLFKVLDSNGDKQVSYEEIEELLAVIKAENEKLYKAKAAFSNRP